jgi:hypothetical protein
MHYNFRQRHREPHTSALMYVTTCEAITTKAPKKEQGCTMLKGSPVEMNNYKT